MIDAEDLQGTAPERRVLTVRQLNEEISAAIAAAYPQTVWVRGEVQRLPQDAGRRAHVYFELHETGGSGAAEYAIPVALMGWDRQRFGLGRFLDGTDPDLQIANQLEVCLECKVDFYAKFGKLSLKVVGVDRHFSLGRLEARRREILAFLREADLLEANARLPLPEVPLRVGLITAAGSAAERDFLSGLEASPWAFRVDRFSARMQGEQLETEVVAALTKLQATAADVVVITRGGGSRADLSWFDQKELALTIAGSSIPVITAIGHEIDRSIADMVAHRSCKTPTAAAEFLIERVGTAAARLDTAAGRLAAVTADRLSTAQRRLDVAPRFARAVKASVLQGRVRVHRDAGQLQQTVSGRLAAAGTRLGDLRSLLATTAGRDVSRSRERLGALQIGVRAGAAAKLTAGERRQSDATRRLRREASRPLASQRPRLDSLATQVRLLDPEWLLARGYTITLDTDGRALSSAFQVDRRDRITTRFKDGQVVSVVAEGAASPAGPQTGKDVRHGGKKEKPQADPRQESLFR